MSRQALVPLFANRGFHAAESSRVPEVLEREVREIYRLSPWYPRRFLLHPEPLHWECWRNLPRLTKQEIVAAGPCAFFEDCDNMQRQVEANLLERESTSGTTTGPMTVIMEAGWWDAQTRRAYAAHPVLAPFGEGKHRKAVLAPVNCSSHLCPYSDFPFPNRWINDTIYLNLSSDPFAFLESEWDRIVHELLAVKPALLEGEPVYLSLLARALLRRKVALPSVRAVILTYGKASRCHGARLAQAFPGVPQVDLYGSTEAGYLFVGNAFDHVRPIEANAFLELEPYTAAPATSDVYEVIVTTRGRQAMPLLRYHSGDLVQRHCDGYRVLGRERDLAVGNDGTLLTVFEIDELLPSSWRLWHFCLHQIGASRWQFDYVADEQAPNDLAERLASKLGSGARVTLQRRKRIAPAASGKFPLFKPAR